jgi:putative molybdopterin biosynthesis protein
VEIDAMTSTLDAGTHARVTLIGSATLPDIVIMGSHCVALDAVVGTVAAAGYLVRTIAVGSLGGVTAAERGECDLAPVHLIDPATGVYNVHLVHPGLVLVKGWQRMQGFVHRAGDARFEGRSAAEAIKVALTDENCLMVNRNAGAGTRVLIDRLLGGARPPGYSNQPRSHNAVAAAVAQGRADWGLRSHPSRKSTGWRSCQSRPSTMIFYWSKTAGCDRRCKLFLPRYAMVSHGLKSARLVCILRTVESGVKGVPGNKSGPANRKPRAAELAPRGL